MLEFTEEIWKMSPFVKLLGLEIEKLVQGVCVSRLRIKDTLLNKHSVVHGE